MNVLDCFEIYKNKFCYYLICYFEYDKWWKFGINGDKAVTLGVTHQQTLRHYGYLNAKQKLKM